MNEHTTSDLAGLAAREAGAPARGPTRIEEIRARVEAATMGAGLDKFGSAIVDDFGRCVVCGKWTNPGHDDAQSHKDGCAARREEVRYAQALHAIYRTGADDLRHLLNELDRPRVVRARLVGATFKMHRRHVALTPAEYVVALARAEAGTDALPHMPAFDAEECEFCGRPDWEAPGDCLARVRAAHAPLAAALRQLADLEVQLIPARTNAAYQKIEAIRAVRRHLRSIPGAPQDGQS